jgi:hypothetical protein
MREVHCPHCNATNRRPKCGGCQKEIADPPAIAFVWKLYQHRKILGFYDRCVIAVLVAAVGNLLLLLSHQPFGMSRASSTNRPIQRRFARAHQSLFWQVSE